MNLHFKEEKKTRYSSIKNFQLTTWSCLFVLAVGSVSIHARAQKNQSKNKTSRQVASEQRSACEHKKTAIQQIHLFIEQAKTFEDIDAKVRTTSELGMLLWPCEPLYTEAILLELHEALKIEIKKRQEDSTAAKQTNLTTEGDNKDSLSLSKLKYLDSYLLSRINLHNPALVKRLAKNETVEWDEVRYDATKTLLAEGDAKKAVVELRKSISSGSGFGTINLLVTLRQRDPSTADTLYLAYLNNLAVRGLPTAREFAEAGAYLFVSGLANDNQSGGLFFSSVDGTFIPQFARKHPAASAKALRAYLTFVAVLLVQPLESLNEKKSRYALGRVLLLHIPQAEPELLAAFSRGIQRLAVEVTDGIKNDRPYQSLANSATQKWDNLDQQLEGIQKIPSTQQRDELCAMLAHSLYSSKLYEKAVKVIKLMSISETRDRLETVVTLAMAHKRLEQRQLLEAQEIALSVAPGPERAVFWLSYAQMLRTSGDDSGATQTLLQSISDARRTTESERPLLLLKAAGVIKATDSVFAKQLFFEAFNNLNALEKWRSPKWEAEAFAHGAILKFPLAGVSNLSFTAALEPFVRDNPKEIEPAITELKSEQLRMEGFLMLAKHFLANAIQEIPVQSKAAKLN
ncbi:MAG TPA: hypothetical protein VFM05_13290 [Candidatus Saccharimonadales bacterium]|nr:hypothetical protein [Candidatus Saccharimonadales bacterium]